MNILMIVLVLIFFSIVLYTQIPKTKEKQEHRKKVKEKSDQLDLAIKFVTDKNLESVGLGVGTTALSFYDIYSAVDNHKEVLDVLEERYNREMADSTPVDWYSKITYLKDKGDQSIGAYISGYAGQAAEDRTVEMFETDGFRAELFESRTHPNDDVRVFDNDGQYIDYSVKSYSDANNFYKAISEHPDSTHYVINSELFSKLEESGKLKEYFNNGIIIKDGGYLNEVLRENASDTFENLTDAGNLAEKVPLIGTLFFGAKVLKNIDNYYNGNISGHETKINVAGDAVKLGSAGLGGTVGAKTGAILGTMIAPGIGTLIGGGIGTVVGAFASSSGIEMIKEQYKWGDIIESIEYFGEKFGNFNSNHPYIKHNIYNLNKIKQDIRIENKLLSKYKKQLDLENSEKITIPAILTSLYTKELEEMLDMTEVAAHNGHKQILKLCEQISAKALGDDFFGRKDTYVNRFLGELLLANREILLPLYKLNEDEKALIKRYDKQLKKAPNHPYIMWKGGSQEVLKGIYLNTLESVQKNR